MPKATGKVPAWRRSPPDLVTGVVGPDGWPVGGEEDDAVQRPVDTKEVSMPKPAAHPKLINWMPGKGDPRTYRTYPQRLLALPALSFRVLDRAPQRGKALRLLRLDMHVASLARVRFAQVEKLLAGSELEGKQIMVVRYLDGDGRRPRRQPIVIGKMRRLRCTPPITFRVRLDYPLRKVVEVTVPPYSNGRRAICTVGWLAWATAQAYDWAYRRWKQVGVWGHGLGDLYLEGFLIREGGIVEPLVGS